MNKIRKSQKPDKKSKILFSVFPNKIFTVISKHMVIPIKTPWIILPLFWRRYGVMSLWRYFKKWKLVPKRQKITKKTKI